MKDENKQSINLKKYIVARHTVLKLAIGSAITTKGVQCCVWVHNVNAITPKPKRSTVDTKANTSTKMRRKIKTFIKTVLVSQFRVVYKFYNRFRTRKLLKCLPMLTLHTVLTYAISGVWPKSRPGPIKPGRSSLIGGPTRPDPGQQCVGCNLKSGPSQEPRIGGAFDVNNGWRLWS